MDYESIEPYESIEIQIKDNPSFRIEKMRFAKKRNKEGKNEVDKSIIIFNKDITVKNIPEKAYEYVVNGRSAIEWIMDQYQVKIDIKSNIVDDPNSYSEDPKYIFNLLLST